MVQNPGGIKVTCLKLQIKHDVQKNASSDNENTLNVGHLGPKENKPLPFLCDVDDP